MLINEITHILKKTPCLYNFYNKSNCNENSIVFVANSARALLTASNFVNNKRTILAVVAGNNNAFKFANELKCYLDTDDVLMYSEPQFSSFDPIRSANRYKALNCLYSLENKIVVASARSLIRKVPSNIKNLSKPIILEKNQEYDIDQLVRSLLQIGYQKLEVLDGPGTFIRRGGTITIYLPLENSPFKLEFFGDEIEDITKLLRSSYQTITSVNKISIYSIKDLCLTKEMKSKALSKLSVKYETNKYVRDVFLKLETQSIFEEMAYIENYFYDSMTSIFNTLDKNVLININEPRAIFDDMLHYYEEISRNPSKTGFNKSLNYIHPTNCNFTNHENISYVSILQKGMDSNYKLTLKRPPKHRNLEHLSTIMKSYLDTNFFVILSIPNSDVQKNISMEIVDYGLSINILNNYDADNHLSLKVVNIVDTVFTMSYLIVEAKIAIFTLSSASLNTYSHAAVKSKLGESKFVDITKITFPFKPGDYVVHSVHGVAYFKDLVKQQINGQTNDYLLLEYAEGDKLYVPIDQFSKVTKYVGPAGDKPKVTRLGTTQWANAIKKASKATKKMAFDLVDVYSRRASSKGFAFKCDDARLSQMESDFVYTETTDQINAIYDVKKDMRNPKPMDRLICGDVGFGKTEVAMRAATICAINKKQTMVLCPTTILAMQHFDTFNNRLKPYNISVKVLSRFVSKKESSKILEKFNSGKIDILIGTHRLLSKDVNPHNLGLLIIDEEQRFGVSHKVHFKNFRDSVEVLTLSATPIPRTMQMATSGVRDTSLILSPPSNRRAVKVHVGEWDIDVVSSAIRNELSRKGQVYYISNRVKNIKDATMRVGDAAGEARIGVAHGQMSKNQLEDVMYKFNQGLIDVLVSTTIVESGIDNPNTNTLIIEDAQNLGLSQMYQLKGRVGRSQNQAYAYFMFSDTSMLNKNAISRLSAINEFSDLGSGTQIALKDLEIRGAGNILGAEQSGNVSNIGFDLFSQMLSYSIEQAQSGTNNNDENANKDKLDYFLPTMLSDIVVNIPGSAYLPDDFIEDISTRVLWYRKFASTKTYEEILYLESQFVKEYDEIPDAAQNFIYKYKIAGLCKNHDISLVALVSNKIVLQGIKLSKLQIRSLKKYKAKYLSSTDKLTISNWRFSNTDSNYESTFNFLESLFYEL